MRKLILYLMLCCMFCSLLNPVYGQTAAFTVQGQVKDTDGKAVVGATISEKGLPGNGTITNIDGRFTLKLKGNSSTIFISLIGYKRLETKVTENSTTFTLHQDEQALNDVVIVGYQSQNRREVTAAISSLKGKDIADIPEASFDQMLQGRLPGVSVLSSTGEVGSKPNIVIRGSTNVDFGNANGGNSGPLYIIDGVIFDVNAIGTAYGNNNPLSLINPSDIESIDVLKDASAAAIYGARGGNGVIIVKTKQAKRGKPQVSISTYAGVTTAPNLIKVTTGAAERALKLKLLEEQLGYSNIQSGVIPRALTDSLNPAFNNDVDWQGLLIRKKTVVNSQSASVAGYAGTTSYRLSVNHYNEQGILNGYGLDKITPHLNLTIQPFKKMSVTVDLLMSSERQSHGVGGAGAYLFTAWNFPSSFLQLSPEQVAVYSGKQHYYDDNRTFTIVGSVHVTDTLAKNLTINSTYGSTNYTDKYDYFSPQILNGTLNTAYSNTSTSPSWSFENFLQYTKEIGKHRFILAAGAALYSYENTYNYASAAGINISGIYTVQTVPAGTNLNAQTSYARKTTESYYARFNYDYSGKYLFTASFRRDATSIYSPQYRWATFPAMAAGWIASDESFFSPLKKVVNFLKFRASYGIDGKDPGQWYSKFQTLSTDASRYVGTNGTITPNGYLGGISSTYNGTTIVSPFPYYNNYLSGGVKSSNSVRWEKDHQIDIGGDMELFNSRVNVTVDWYQKDAKDVFFYNVPAQATSGYQYYSGNYVDIRNQGLEFATNINVLGPRSPFKWNFNFNISINKNLVTKLPNDNRDFLFGDSWFYKTLTLGEPLFSYRVFHTNGVYATDAQVPVDPVTGKKETYYGVPLQAGDPKYVDVNGDYNITNDDKYIAGNPNPKYTGGFGSTFNYKRITLSFFASYVAGRKILNGALSDALNGTRAIGGWGSIAGVATYTGTLNQFWQASGDQTTYARLVYPNGSQTDPWNIGTDYFIRDGSFIKLKNVTLGYDLPDRWIKPLGLRRVNVYLMGDNLAIWKKAKDIADPELVDPTTGSSNVIYPTAAKYTLGLNIDL
ncbi:SusC/RagA family TonB-linked outer membrane protein [Mucilaginibacter sp. FT3.2]|uniref:SusC/RagA family TonB-linked outer membrane protein n=1 Tax=Mucilaginibacter sp. FT3.2 TaxID=2723090 RepID=UPI00160E10E1|nr:SusC/RagA family TonB-linked outer membrane protein [Mucilaginibacter sp. FT3.2]MBB6231618.1 TonB-linked SusC/RagA family outer membrane protein [Mucilaginibacter sp. FT3.2]